MSEDVSGSTISLYDISGSQPTVVPTISLTDILNATEVVTQREAADKTALDGISTITFETLRASLVRWAGAGFPNAYTVYEVPISPPETCSDGAKRSLADYIVYVSGKTIQDHVAALQERVVDMAVSFAYTGSSIVIIVSKHS